MEIFFRHPLKIARICFFKFFFLHILLIQDVKASRNINFQLSGAILGVYRTPKVGCFFKMVKILHFCYFVQVVPEDYALKLSIFVVQKLAFHRNFALGLANH